MMFIQTNFFLVLRFGGCAVGSGLAGPVWQLQVQPGFLQVSWLNSFPGQAQ
jgi:hypothetical protein